jgi:hypothetical protein
MILQSQSEDKYHKVYHMMFKNNFDSEEHEIEHYAPYRLLCKGIEESKLQKQLDKR